MSLRIAILFLSGLLFVYQPEATCQLVSERIEGCELPVNEDIQTVSVKEVVRSDVFQKTSGELLEPTPTKSLMFLWYIVKKDLIIWLRRLLI